MNMFAIFSLLLIVLVGYTSAQVCNQSLSSCEGPPNGGTGGRGCVPRNVWYYDGRARQCREMRYFGCGGNRNRWCSRADCERRCRR